MVKGTFPPGLEARLKKMGAIAVAFSGGLDSRFLCHAALLHNIDVLAVHASGPHIPDAESRKARSWATSRNLPLLELAFDPLDLPEVKNNSRERCYGCKKALLTRIGETLKAAGEYARILCDGGNADDLEGYRPGVRAVREAGVISPLNDLSKSEIRHYAAITGMDRPDQKARPCLLTRLAYDMPPDAEILERIASCEERLQILFNNTLDAPPDFRLRLTPEPVLHMTRAVPELRARIASIMSDCGFTNAAVEAVEKVSGFFDRENLV